MSFQDPFYVARDQVQDSINKVQKMFDSWQDMLNNTNTAKNMDFERRQRQITDEIEGIQEDLNDLDATIDAADRQRAKFHMDVNEIDNRRRFVQNSRRALKQITDSLGSQQTLAKVERDKRELLAERQKPRVEKKSAIQSSNNDFLDQHKQQQTMLIREQDDQLDELALAVDRLGTIAGAVNVELDEQRVMLEDLDRDVDKATEKMNFVMKRLGKLLKTSDKGKIITIIVLIAILVLMLFLVIYV
eukprot:GILI01016531.1.p1 GENE.GILI01016531.1~~GILI01016531.1.p1  ORF type:complete len:245 (-),score=66.71 GILI01016531.1:49-783(-)